MLTSEMHGGCLRLTLDGPLTIYQAGELKAQLQSLLGAAQEAELDLAAVDEIDSAGLQLLWLFKRDAMQAGRSLRIAAHGDASHELVASLGLDSWFGKPDGEAR